MNYLNPPVNPMNPAYVPFTGNATHSPNSPPVQAAPTTPVPHQL